MYSYGVVHHRPVPYTVEQAQVAVVGRGSRRGRPLAAGVPSRDSAHLGGRSRLAPPVVAVCVQQRALSTSGHALRTPE